VRNDNFIPETSLAVHRSRGRLPHWFINEATYSVTFRLRDSLPRDLTVSLLQERARLLSTARTASERLFMEKSFFLRFDHALDQAYGSCILRHHGALFKEVLTHFDGARFTLHSWCMMPNHAHVLFSTPNGLDVPTIVGGWKSTVSHRIGAGPIWQREYYDRIVRSPREFDETAAYIRNNPTVAGLLDWPWVG
jgi:putative transposase